MLEPSPGPRSLPGPRSSWSTTARGSRPRRRRTCSSVSGARTPHGSVRKAAPAWVSPSCPPSPTPTADASGSPRLPAAAPPSPSNCRPSPSPGRALWGAAATAGEPASGGGTTTGWPPSDRARHGTFLRSGPSCLRRDNASESGRTCRHGTERLAVTSSPGRAPNRVHRSDPNSPPGRLRRVRRRGSLLLRRERLSHHRPARHGCSATRPTSPPAPPPDLVPHAVLRPGNLCRRPLPGRASAASTPTGLGVGAAERARPGGDERFTQAAPRSG